MRKVYRGKHNNDYWEQRWTHSGVDLAHFENLEIYPIKYSERIIQPGQKVLEAGCGAGRLYFHYRHQGIDIHGLEYAHSAVENILKHDPKAHVIQGSVTEMPYGEGEFESIVAFGLFHNFEDERDVIKAFQESSRVLSTNGKMVFSVRYDSFENNLIEKIVKFQSSTNSPWNQFHRMHFDLADIKKLTESNHLSIVNLEYARNVSFLFKFDFFREKQMKKGQFKESEARSVGFQLNIFGRMIDKLLHSVLPKLFSNILVIEVEKKA